MFHSHPLIRFNTRDQNEYQPKWISGIQRMPRHMPEDNQRYSDERMFCYIQISLLALSSILLFLINHEINKLGFFERIKSQVFF